MLVVRLIIVAVGLGNYFTSSRGGVVVDDIAHVWLQLGDEFLSLREID